MGEGCCVSLLFIAVINAATESNLGREVFIWLSLSCYSSPIEDLQGWNSGRNPEAGIETGNTEEHGFLACSPWFAQLLFFYSLRDGTSHNGPQIL